MVAIIEKALIDNYGLSIPEAKKISEAIDIVDTFKKNLQIKDESKYLATKEDIANVETKIANVETKIANVEARLTNKIYISLGMCTGFISLLMTIFKFLH